MRVCLSVHQPSSSPGLSWYNMSLLIAWSWLLFPWLNVTISSLLINWIKESISYHSSCPLRCLGVFFLHWATLRHSRLWLFCPSMAFAEISQHPWLQAIRDHHVPLLWIFSFVYILSPLGFNTMAHKCLVVVFVHSHLPPWPQHCSLLVSLVLLVRLHTPNLDSPCKGGICLSVFG